MKRGGAGRGQGRKPLPPYLQRVKLTGVRLPAYKLDAIKTQGEPTALIEAALDEKYEKLFDDVLTTKRNETDNAAFAGARKGGEQQHTEWIERGAAFSRACKRSVRRRGKNHDN